MEKDIALAGIWLFAAATALSKQVSGGFMLIVFLIALIMTGYLV